MKILLKRILKNPFIESTEIKLFLTVDASGQGMLLVTKLLPEMERGLNLN